MMEADDLALVSRAKSGDAEAFRALVVRSQRRVYAVALGIVKDRDLAWDVSQEAFVRVHDLAAAGEGILATGLGNDPQQNLLRRELATHMTQALAQLPEKHRAILV